MFISEDWLILFFLISPFGVIYVLILAFKLGKWLAYWGCYWYTFFTCNHVYVQGKHSEKGSVLFCVNCYHTKADTKGE